MEDAQRAYNHEDKVRGLNITTGKEEI